jgi:hypothetical protein
MPIQTDASETPDIVPDLVDEAAAMTGPSRVAFSWTVPNIAWTACACAHALLLLGSLIWLIVR